MAPKRAKTASQGKASSSSRTIDIAAAAAGAAKSSSKRSISADWGGSTVTAEQLKTHWLTGLIPSNAKARAPGDEVVPAPAKDEVVVFTKHLEVPFCNAALSLFSVAYTLSSLSLSFPTASRIGRKHSFTARIPLLQMNLNSLYSLKIAWRRLP